MKTKRRTSTKKNRAQQKKARVAKPRAKRRLHKSARRTAKTKRSARRVVREPSSGAASSSLDPHRIGRLTVERPGAEFRRGRSAGDDQGISRSERLDSESVEELLEEGQAFEAAAIEGVEDALDADQGEVRTHEVPEDDVPEEYDNRDR